MMQFEIWWDDLNKSAKKRLKDMYHENIDMSPIAYVEIEDDEEEEENDSNEYKIDE